MRALVLKGPREAAVEEVMEPVRDASLVLLKVDRVGLCGSDLNSFRGMNPMVTYPRILGHEIAATVVDPGAADLKPGTRVTVSPYTNCGECSSCRQGRVNACRSNQTFGVQRDGALTELLQVPAAKLFTAQLDTTGLCLVEPLTVGFHAVARAQVSVADTVAVIGCGGVGLGAIAGAAFRGARTIAIDVDDAKIALAKKAGASEGVNTRQESIADALRRLTDGRGPEVIIEAVGRPETFRAAVEEVGFSGRVVYIGYAKEPVSYETRLFVQKELDIRGSRNALPEDFRDVIRMLEAGRFPVAEAVSAVVPLADSPRVLAEWSAQPEKFAKIMVEVHGSRE